MKPPQAPVWMSMQAAATILGLSVVTLRRAIERSAVRSPEGGVESRIDGVRARKFGRLWRVALANVWTSPVETR